MSSRGRIARLGQAGHAVQVAASQIALAGSNYLVLAVAARNLDAGGFAALSSYYLLINTVGRGLFAAVELEATRAVAAAAATGGSLHAARRNATVHTGLLLVGALVLVVACTPLLGHVVGSGAAVVALLAAGAASIAVSYWVRGPLAGRRRYPPYAATFWLEALAGLTAAVVLAAVGVTSTVAWIAVFALAPLLAATPLLHPGVRRLAPDDSRTPGPAAVPGTGDGRGALLWSAALLLAGQGVWNLAPVVVTARLADTPAVAAGFVTVAVILRAPVLVFPAVQALLLPSVTAMLGTGDDAAVRRTTRKLGGFIAAGGVVWLVLAVTVVPTVAQTVFAATVTPPTWVLLALAVSTVIGAATQIAQTHLVAAQRQRRVAIAWITGLGVLLVVGLLVPPPLVGATLGQLAGATAVLVLLDAARRRLSTIGARP